VLGFLLYPKKSHCEICHQAFDKEEELFKHAKEEHHKAVIKCHNCGMQFLHEKDRLHHIQEEKKKKVDIRRHR
jgi:tRNA U54 and U55 pseudouridine synthase Pus10